MYTANEGLFDCGTRIMYSRQKGGVSHIITEVESGNSMVFILTKYLLFKYY